MDHIVSSDSLESPQMFDADERTLALASPMLSTARLDALVTYQRVFLQEVAALSERHPTSADWTSGVSSAHQAAQDACGMSAAELSRVSAAVQDFCGKRWAIRTLERRLQQIRSGKCSADPQLVGRIEDQVAHSDWRAR